MGNFEKLGILVIVILVVVILVLAIWGVGVPTEDLFPNDDPTALSSEMPNGVSDHVGPGGDVVVPPPQPAPEGDEESDQIWPAPPPAPDTPPSPAPGPGPSEVTPPPPAPEPAFTEHVVKKHETLSAISLAHYGTKGHWKKILAANPGIDPNALKIGAVLRIPRLDAAAPAVTPSPPASSGDVYVVRKGDSLWKIARALGTSTQVLHDANRDVIGPDAASIKPGMKLTIPR